MTSTLPQALVIAKVSAALKGSGGDYYAWHKNAKDELIRDVLAALADAGYCVVPKEPTEAMLDVVAPIPNTWSELEKEKAKNWREHFRNMYNAMLTASGGREG